MDNHGFEHREAQIRGMSTHVWTSGAPPREGVGTVAQHPDTADAGPEWRQGPSRGHHYTVQVSRCGAFKFYLYWLGVFGVSRCTIVKFQVL
jgi:hypothetical protein